MKKLLYGNWEVCVARDCSFGSLKIGESQNDLPAEKCSGIVDRWFLII